jgi:uncharacterized protein (TIGR03382 family)
VRPYRSRPLAAWFSSVTLDALRPLAALVLPPLLTLAIASGATRIVGGLSSSARPHAQGIVWGKRTFVSRAEFARWLESRGGSYQAWARRHPVDPAPVRPKARSSSPRRSTTMLGGVAGLGVVLVLGLAVLVRRRRALARLRPRLGSSYERAHSVTLLAWHDHPTLVWYFAGGVLVAGAALVVVGRS